VIRWVLAVVLVGGACGGSRSEQRSPAAGSVIANAPVGETARCRATEYAKRPVEAESMLVANGALYWLDLHGGAIYSIPIGGGKVRKIADGELNASARSLIRVGSDLVYVDSDRGAVKRVPLAGGEPSEIVDGIRHARAVVHVAGVYVVGSEDGLYMYDPKTDETIDIVEDDFGVDVLAAHGDVAYALTTDQLLEIRGRGKVRTLIRSIRKMTQHWLDGEESIALAVTSRGALWTTNLRALWLYEFATGKSRKLGQTADIATSILVAGDDVYIAGGKNIERLQGDTLSTVPIDTSTWDGRDTIWAIAASESSLFYLSAWNTLAETCR
jgi:ligand-binding sensor domain-containing protein